jgi:hypothetical protein
MNSKAVIPEPPVHPLSALATIALDLIWTVIEIPVTLSVVGLSALLPLCLTLGLICSLAVSLIQRFVARDAWGASVAKGFVMGIFAGVPYPVMGTAIGILLAGWAGLHMIEKKRLSSRRQKYINDDLPEDN